MMGLTKRQQKRLLRKQQEKKELEERINKKSLKNSKPCIEVEDNINYDEKTENGASKIVVYTCISGGYDTLKEVMKPESNIDYICFTDRNIESKVWKIRKIPEYLNSLDHIRIARCIKILPHIFLPEYEISVWVDGHIQILGDINKFINENLLGHMVISKHPRRNCIYEEAKAIIKEKRDEDYIVNKQVLEYKEKGFPENNGLVQSGIMIRKHNEEECVNISEEWWGEVRKKSKRDQLSFNYVIWGKNIQINMIRPSIMQSQHFSKKRHITKN